MRDEFEPRVDGVFVDDYLRKYAILCRNERLRRFSIGNADLASNNVNSNIKIMYNASGVDIGINGVKYTNSRIYDKNAYPILNKMELTYVLKNEKDKVCGGIVYIEGLGKEMKCNLKELAEYINYWNATNFTVATRNSALYLKGKNGCKLEDIDVLMDIEDDPRCILMPSGYYRMRLGACRFLGY